MDVGDWLRTLALSEYEPAFRDNKIDGEVLPKLTGDDLKELGVASVGHRRKLLSAIKELSRTYAEPTAIAPASVNAAAERRQLTVMFCDLVGSTALAARLDPEDTRGIIATYQKCCATLVASHGGFVAKYMGDGVLAYFGYPHAHEHDAERAVRSGLAIVDAAPKLQTSAGGPLHVRVGIATGIVVVGDLLGSGESQERGVVGDTPNLAARLQGIAQPDNVVIAEGTRKLLGDLFVLQNLDTPDLKGVPGSTRAYAALRESLQESRFEALHAGGLTALVGRQEETELLLRLWAKANDGQGQALLLSGEAGIGKSRLTAAFLERLAGGRHTRMRYFCSPHHSDSAFYPIIGHMERAAGLAREDNAEARLNKLDAMLAKTSTSPEDAALLAAMLSVSNDGRYPALELGPPQRRQKTMEALIRQIDAIARQSPALMIFEDAHWADPSSLELFGQLVDRIDSWPVLLFATFRPEFVAPWFGRRHVTALTLTRLARPEVMALIEGVAGDKPLADKIRQDIVERADGIPLFVEEMTKAVLEAESEGEAARTIAAVPSPALAVPASLHASLMARLDRLGRAKAIAQIGAAIGREFSYALLAPVSRLPEPELTAALELLLQSGLVFPQGAPPRATYLFKHALVQDAAYGTLLREPRRTLHARIAEALESQFPDIAETRPELLARHCSAAGLTHKAAALWGKAGQLSLARSALVEAADQLTRALALVAALPATSSQRRQEIDLQVALITPLIHVKGYSAPETRAAAERAQLLIERADGLGEPLEDPLVLFTVLNGFWMVNFVAFKADAVRELAAQFLALAENQEATGPRVLAHRVMGISLVLTGNIAKGRTHLDRAIALYNPIQHRSLATRFGQDAAVSALCYRSHALWFLGHPEAALVDSEKALSEAREIGQAATLMYALFLGSSTHILRRDDATANSRLNELLALADEKGAAFFKAMGTALRGCVLALTGEASKAVPLLNHAIAAERALGSTIAVPYFLSFLAKAHGDLGQFDNARRSIREAMKAAATTGEKWFEADFHRIAGEIERMSPEPDAVKAHAHFERSLEIARAQHERSWELRAATSLARLWRDHGRRREAHDLLAPIYGWFTEGFDTPDLKDAKSLLEGLT